MSRLTISVAVAAAIRATAPLAQTAGIEWSSSQAVGLGPLLLGSQSPVNILQLTPTPMPPVTIDRGRWAVGILESRNNHLDNSRDAGFHVGPVWRLPGGRR